jgi:hypothetical protein
MGSSHALRHDIGVSSTHSFAPVSLLLSSTSFDHKTEKYGSFSLDSSNRKPAHLETRERVRNDRETGVAPTHMSCIGAVVEMSFCSAHEINQPITSLRADAQAALRFPTSQSPNLAAVRHALTRVLPPRNRLPETVAHTRVLNS